jgi:hypothetical protein
MSAPPRSDEPTGLFEALAQTHMGRADGGGGLRPRLSYAFDLPLDAEPADRVDNLTHSVAHDEGDVRASTSGGRAEGARKTDRVESGRATPVVSQRSAADARSHSGPQPPSTDSTREMPRPRSDNPPRIEALRPPDPTSRSATEPTSTPIDRGPMRERVVETRTVTTVVAPRSTPPGPPSIRPALREPLPTPVASRVTLGRPNHGLAQRSRPEPTIEIHIGRLEVRAPAPSSTRTETPQRTARDARLSAHLQRRAAGARS